jgi:hypothetical protein
MFSTHLTRVFHKQVILLAAKTGGREIDPKGMSTPTLRLSKQYEITHILETHIHADFLAGSRELAALTEQKCTFQPKADKLNMNSHMLT